MIPKKILVVDDDAYVRTLVVKILNGRGYVALPAVDAWQAMDQLQQHDIDLIILDLRMPGPVDGEQLLFTLRDQGNDVPVIVLSGWVDDDIRKTPPDAVHAVLKKPIKVDSFAETVAAVLGETQATSS
ncbi:MAG TPA: response regulator [Candidatus Latescibacteria bacterium]|jgi:CheY-like chemotaxis protein|nr:response regulator [Candidatus Latescibacterota bacterium]|tara:strand:- start:26 stop:409 length:384 start_codon:yes stop_codon:yes gene_type:complete